MTRFTTIMTDYIILLSLIATTSYTPPASELASSIYVLLLRLKKLLLLRISYLATMLASMTSASAMASRCIGVKHLLLIRSQLHL